MAHKQNGLEYANGDTEESWLENLTKEMKESRIRNSSDKTSPTLDNIFKNSKTDNSRLRRTSLDTSGDYIVKPQVATAAHSAGTLRHHSNNGYQNGRRKYVVRNEIDFGDSPNGSNDFLNDLLPHYVTPRHRRLNNVIDEDFYDVILGPRYQDGKGRRKSVPKESSSNLQQNTAINPVIKNTTIKPTSLSSVSNSNAQRDKVKSEFVIPELPGGRLLEIKIYSNWGDKYFVGMNGIEMFDSNGNVVQIDKIWTDSESGDQSQQGRIQNVCEGAMRTRDERHAWAAPAPRTAPLSVTALLPRTVTLAVLRIWNYNKSRIYSTRGIRLVQIKLDDQVIFHGEIARASGELNGPLSSFGDTILFTKDPAILDSVMRKDKNFLDLLKDNEPMKDLEIGIERPPTANDSSHNLSPKELLEALDSEERNLKYVAKKIKLSLMSNWGHMQYIGLTGIEILCFNDKIQVHRAYAYTAPIPEDNVPEHRLLDCKSLFNGRNITSEFEDMWCVEFEAGNEFAHVILELKEPTELTSEYPPSEMKKTYLNRP